MTKPIYLLFFLSLLVPVFCAAELRGTGDLGLVIERETGSALIINTTDRSVLSRIEGLGDVSHASVVFSRDQRYAFVFGRDGGLSKIDLLLGNIEKRIIQAGNSIGGAISQNGKLIAVSNYTPGGVKIFSSETLEPLSEIPAINKNNHRSKVIGLVDAPRQLFICSLFDAGEIWIIDAKNPKQPKIKKFTGIGKQPYDALLTPNGRYYLAGLFGEPGLALLDLWNIEEGIKRILGDYGKHEAKLPVYKMPHLEGWAIAGNLMFIPAVGRHEVLVVDTDGWQLLKRIPVAGQPVFVMAQPDERQIWVNFALPDNHLLQVIDVKDMALKKTLSPGKSVLHMEFTPRGENVWVSVRDENKVLVYNTENFTIYKTLNARKPSGIFFTSRANQLGL